MVQRADERATVAWLHRALGFGLAADELTAAVARGAVAEATRLLDPDRAGVAAAPDPWDDAQVPSDPKAAGAARLYAPGAWLDAMVASPRPLDERLAWLWHGWLTSALDKVRSPWLMVEQIRLFRRSGRGRFSDLLRAVTTDAAMLRYLDGAHSDAAGPNENYSRELLELFALGIGAYTEADVKAGARALTGWAVAPATGAVRFRPGQHDDTMQTFLGRSGVHDVDTVIAAVAAHPGLPDHVARRFVAALLGPSATAVVDAATDALRASGLGIDGLLRAVVTAALASGRPTAPPTTVMAPVPWLVTAQRVTGGRLPRGLALQGLRDAGQVPLLPPSVAGWPAGDAWFATNTVVARVRLAAALAAVVPDGPVLAAAAGTDLDLLADRLGLVTPAFGPATTAALRATSAPRPRLVLALVSPEFVLV